MRVRAWMCACTLPGSATPGRAGCFNGQDVFATVRENSPMGELIVELSTETEEANSVHWSLSGKDADWLFLEGRSVRLNTSSERVLDREVKGPLLIAVLTCYDDSGFKNSEFRIMVEILNENDNQPVFVNSTLQPVSISELTAVDTLVFSVQAVDADGDTIIYSIDQSSPDAGFFKIELPNSGKVMLAKPLDYETQTQLHVTIYASEMTTPERLWASATVTIHVTDGDDQYPHFLPCTPLPQDPPAPLPQDPPAPLPQDPPAPLCTHPVYSANVTEGEKDIVLEFSPGPIRAVDGDRALSAPLRYNILPGADAGHFLMDEVTGAVRLTRGVEDRLLTPTLRLLVVAYQVDDQRKYCVATVVVRVLAVNRFPPRFDQDEYRGFVTEGDQPASLLTTYGNGVLVLRIRDRDFTDGINPRMHYSLKPTSDHSQFYRVTQEGLLIARANQLRPAQHSLEVEAVDEETGDTAQASVMVEVLYEGQEVPQGPWGELGSVSGCTVSRALGLCCLLMAVLGALLWAMLALLRRSWREMDPGARSYVAQAKEPNVSLQWFQVVSYRNPLPVWDEASTALPAPPPPSKPPNPDHSPTLTPNPTPIYGPRRGSHRSPLPVWDEAAATLSAPPPPSRPSNPSPNSSPNLRPTPTPTDGSHHPAPPHNLTPSPATPPESDQDPADSTHGWDPPSSTSPTPMSPSPPTSASLSGPDPGPGISAQHGGDSSGPSHSLLMANQELSSDCTSAPHWNADPDWYP